MVPMYHTHIGPVSVASFFSFPCEFEIQKTESFGVCLDYIGVIGVPTEASIPKP